MLLIEIELHHFLPFFFPASPRSTALNTPPIFPPHFQVDNLLFFDQYCHIHMWVYYLNAQIYINATYCFHICVTYTISRQITLLWTTNKETICGRG